MLDLILAPRIDVGPALRLADLDEIKDVWALIVADLLGEMVGILVGDDVGVLVGVGSLGGTGVGEGVGEGVGAGMLFIFPFVDSAKA